MGCSGLSAAAEEEAAPELADVEVAEEEEAADEDDDEDAAAAGGAASGWVRDSVWPIRKRQQTFFSEAERQATVPEGDSCNAVVRSGIHSHHALVRVSLPPLLPLRTQPA